MPHFISQTIFVSFLVRKILKSSHYRQACLPHWTWTILPHFLCRRITQGLGSSPSRGHRIWCPRRLPWQEFLKKIVLVSISRSALSRSRSLSPSPSLTLQKLRRQRRVLCLNIHAPALRPVPLMEVHFADCRERLATSSSCCKESISRLTSNNTSVCVRARADL